MPYADGFVIPISKRRVADYRKLARKAGKIWMEHGALEFRDQVNARVMKDPRPRSMGSDAMPFDPKRMAFGGFRVIVDFPAA